MQRFPQNDLKGKKTDTVSLKLPNLQCIKCLILTALIHAFTRNQAVKWMSVRTVYPPPPPKKKGFALRGFLGTCPSVKKMCTNLQSKQMRHFKTRLRSRKDVKLNFLLCSRPIFFFCLFQSSVKGITLNEKLSTFYFFLLHLLFFLLVV